MGSSWSSGLSALGNASAIGPVFEVIGLVGATRVVGLEPVYQLSRHCGDLGGRDGVEAVLCHGDHGLG